MFRCFHCHRKIFVKPEKPGRAGEVARLLELGWKKLGRSEYACPDCPVRKP